MSMSCVALMLGCVLTLSANAGSGRPRCNLGNAVEYGVGESAMFCVFLSTNPLRKMIFRLKVDEHSTMMLQGSQKLTIEEGTSQPVYTWISGTQAADAFPLDCASDAEDERARGSVVSCPQIYASGSHVAKVLNLVINLQDGHVSSFAWDNGCSACAPSSCMLSSKTLDVMSQPRRQAGGHFNTGACGEDVPKCPPGDQNECDMKVFVTWAGTDKDGRNLKSAGLRMSKFTGATLNSVFNTMKDNYNTLGQAGPVPPAGSSASPLNTTTMSALASTLAPLGNSSTSTTSGPAPQVLAATAAPTVMPTSTSTFGSPLMPTDGGQMSNGTAVPTTAPSVALSGVV